ncbi:MAG: PLP-dependent aminotransferase family protein [Alphaproteobacteria bacterium]|nr:PLP-dependent aminotransferase family protein [Alphaproteobacteria bacterium]
MRDTLFHLQRVKNVSIQVQIREMMVAAILNGQLQSGQPLPSSRKLAKGLGVSRNTVVLAYQGLVDDGYLMARERSGFYVNPEILEGRTAPQDEERGAARRAPDWRRRLQVQPSGQANIVKPLDWLSYPYPFIYGQVDQSLFPLAAWRECSRQALGRREMEAWTNDTHGRDDPMLVGQVRTRLLPRRGISAQADEILITLGAQHALYLLASLLVSPRTEVAIEDPGYPDVRNIFRLKTDHVRAIPVDDGGIVVDERLDSCDYVYVTPSHQFPTTVTMPLERRQALLEKAAAEDFLIIEDDYEFETNYVSEPTPALKSLDREDRVIYVGSLSKTIFPGLRLGYLVAPTALLAEARALRRLMVRHAPTNNQRTTALFLSLGHHDALIHRLHRAYRSRCEEMGRTLAKYLPQASQVPTFGGTSYWVRGPRGLDAEKLADAAREVGIIIEPGGIYFEAARAPRNYFRLGFSSIDLEHIEPGIRLLCELIHQQTAAAG